MTVTAEVLPLAGVVLGAGMSWSAGALTERSRFRRERKARLQDSRIDAYATFSVAAKESMSILFRVAAGKGVDDQRETLDLQAALPQLAAAFHAREGAFERVRLLGEDDVWEAARRWVRGIYAMRDAVDEPGLTREQWSSLVQQVNGDRDGFHAVARREIAALIDS